MPLSHRAMKRAGAFMKSLKAVLLKNHFNYLLCLLGYNLPFFVTSK
jgi:hypothetical protein